MLGLFRDGNSCRSFYIDHWAFPHWLSEGSGDVGRIPTLDVRICALHAYLCACVMQGIPTKTDIDAIITDYARRHILRPKL